MKYCLLTFLVLFAFTASQVSAEDKTGKVPKAHLKGADHA